MQTLCILLLVLLQHLHPNPQKVAANWKALVDNFLECYHCDTAHKDFVDMVDMTLYQSVIHPRHVYNYSPCKPDNTAYVFSPDDPNHAIHYYWLWPNTVVYSAPGQFRCFNA